MADPAPTTPDGGPAAAPSAADGTALPQAGAPGDDAATPDGSAGAEQQSDRARKVRPLRGEQVELTVTDIAQGGNGVARTDAGWVVFVRGGVTGDRVRATVTKRKRDYGEALVDEILEPSPDRIAPAADHPGAPWQVLPYALQLETKARQVADALRRMGGHADVEIEEIVPAVQEWRYRNKLEYSFGEVPDDHVPGGSILVCGFHAPGSWERIEHVEDCLLASERGDLARRVVHEWCAEQGLGAYDRRTKQGLLRNLVVREGTRTGDLQVRIVTSAGEFDVDALGERLAERLDPAPTGLLWTRISGVGETTFGGTTEVVTGSEHLHDEVRGLRLRIGPESFFQTNTEMADVLYGLAGEYAALEGWERLFDLYCGGGAVGLTMATRVGELVGVEIVDEAILDAAHNAKANGVQNARYLAADARKGLPEVVERVGRPDVLVVDPPRAGLGPRVCRRIIEAAPKRIVYVSCNPTTLAPDAARLVEAGYRFVKARPVDLFPQTPHVECVALLERVA